jgi:DNA repair exonuclease SbcCD ATPase subunit
VSELQGDIVELKRSLEEQQRILKQSDKEKSTLIGELREQNVRLTTQLKDASKKEESLAFQLQSLKDQFSLRKVAMSDHVSHLENLRQEVSVQVQLETACLEKRIALWVVGRSTHSSKGDREHYLTHLFSDLFQITIIASKKSELERSIQILLSEKEGLSSHLEDSSDRISLLQRQTREQEVQLINNRHEINEMKVANQALSTRYLWVPALFAFVLDNTGRMQPGIQHQQAYRVLSHTTPPQSFAQEFSFGIFGIYRKTSGKVRSRMTAGSLIRAGSRD